MALESQITQVNATAIYTQPKSRVSQISASILFVPIIAKSHVTQLTISTLFHTHGARLTQLSITALTGAPAVLKRHFTRIPRIRI